MEDNYKDLRSLIIADPQLAIIYCKVRISSTFNFEKFQDFYDFHSKNSHISTCQNSWSDILMSIHCSECGIDSNSCMCLQCFLNSNHQGHEYHISTYSSGNCDCGDSSFCRPSGFCTKHHGLEHDSHPEDYLEKPLRTYLTDIAFRSFFSAILKIQPNDISTLTNILQFLQLFSQFGDGFRRLLVISLTEKINFEKFINRFFEASSQFNQMLEAFFGLLTNDELFKSNFSKFNYKLMIDRVIPISLSIAKGIDIEIYKNTYPWDNFWFHSYNPQIMKNASEKGQINWVEFTIKVLSSAKEIFTFKDMNYCRYDYVPSFVSFIKRLADYFIDQSDEEKQNLFDQFVIEILSKEINKTILMTSFDEDVPENYFAFVSGFDFNFYTIMKAFKSCEKVSFEKLFELIDKQFDISPIFTIGKNTIANGIVNDNDKLVYNLVKPANNLTINDKNFKSFANGSSFFISNPLMHSLAHLLRNDECCRLKVAELLSLEKYQSARIQIGIASLKSLIAMICFSQLLVPETNLGLKSLLSPYVNDPRYVNFGIPRLFPLLQLVIGIRSNQNNEFNIKEFFAFEMAREIGIFDDLNPKSNEGNKKQMTFAFLYMSLLLVAERNLFNFDGFKFNKEQIVFELKQGVSDLNVLNKSFDRYVQSNVSSYSVMNKIIHEVATARQNKRNKNTENNENDVSFELKEGVEVNFISAINSFNKEKTLMDNEIKKHPDQLLKIQQFEPEELYFFKDSEKVKFSLKEFLITPTVFSIVYQTLRKSSESKTNEVNDHLAMNILLLISKFVDDSNFRSDDSVKPTIKPNKVIKYKSNIIDLITQLKRSVFNYSMNRNGSFMIQNTITKEAFDLFVRMKISSSIESPKSIVDILIEKGELGKNVLRQMGIEIENDNENKQDDVKQMKKNRAKKMKEDILTHFKSISSSFSLDENNEDNESETDNNSSEKEDVCSICSLALKDEILSYPLYIYRTKFPFIFDKPPLVEMTQFNATREADVLQDVDILQPPNFEQEDYEAQNDTVLDTDTLMAQLLATTPIFDITDDMNEEQASLVRSSHDIIHNLASMRHEQMVQQAAEKKNERKRQRFGQFQWEKDQLAKKQAELKEPNSIVSKRCTAGNLFVIQFGICQHLVHPNCVQQDDFTCPIDRSFKNGFLPNIDDLNDDVIYADKPNLSEKMKEALNIFINKYSNFFRASEIKILDVFVELIKSLSGLITTYEVRLRSLPDCLDSKKNKILARNLFLTTWHAYRMMGKPPMKTGFLNDVSENVDVKLTFFQRFIKKLIESDEIEKDVPTKNEVLNQFVSSFVQSIKEEKEKCLFLRRVCLADHFLLNNKTKEKEEEGLRIKNPDLIDWDEIFSLQNLSQKFNVPFQNLNDEFEFKPFIFSKIPKDFLWFAKEPYNFPVELVGQFTIFNILDYNNMIACYNDLDENDDVNTDFMNELAVINNDKANLSLHQMFSGKNYPSVLLFIGQKASSVLVIDGKRMKYMRPFYLDKYGCTDIGYSRSQPLFLNEERYERFMDRILSGEFTNNLEPF